MKTESRWTLATAEDDGKPLIFRIRTDAPPFATCEEFPHLLAVSWQFQSPNDTGMPSHDDSERMAELENLLESGLEGGEQAFLSAIVTGNGVREWQWYARDPDTIMGLVNETIGHLNPFPIEFSFQDDPEWVGYQGFLDMLNSAAEPSAAPDGDEVS